MAFKNRDLSVIGYANGFTLWHYKSYEDKLEDVCNLGYFNNVMTLVNTGDVIIINGKDLTGIRMMELVGEEVWIRELR